MDYLLSSGTDAAYNAYSCFPGYQDQFVAGAILAVIIPLGMVFVFTALFVFMLGLALYYFTGDKPGAHILRSWMRVVARMYTQGWMLVSTFAAAFGLWQLLKGIMALVSPELVIGGSATMLGTSAAYEPRDDLRYGFIIFVFSAVIFLVHWFIARMFESPAEQRGTLISKMAAAKGLVIFSLILFGSIFVFMFNIAGNLQSRAGTPPGSALAMLLSALPFWLFYLARTIWMIRNERANGDDRA